MSYMIGWSVAKVHQGRDYKDIGPNSKVAHCNRGSHQVIRILSSFLFCVQCVFHPIKSWRYFTERNHFSLLNICLICCILLDYLTIYGLVALVKNKWRSSWSGSTHPLTLILFERPVLLLYSSNESFVRRYGIDITFV
jgi:membrane-bound metal-dependent hydrolase YbcI (DUF457 family)